MDRAAQQIASIEVVDIPVRDDDDELRALAQSAGFTATAERSGIMWMEADERPGARDLPPGFVIVDRRRPRGSHPMIRRNGKRVEERLRQCSLYDPSLDLAIAAEDVVAGYALFWFDPHTGVGLVEPMRIEEGFQRRGLGRALLTAGLDRLAERGARRLKVGYTTDAASVLYRGVGFSLTSTATTYRRSCALA
jgi:ribosomal protein S18 acetylase RimI-like enzyme